MDELNEYNMKPCPKCGSDDVWLSFIIKGYDYERFYVCCDKCGNKTDLFETKEKALISWDTTPREFITRTTLYDEMCHLLTDYEQQGNVSAEDFCVFLVKLQNNWDVMGGE